MKNVLIIADIEGSSGCGSYRASSFMTPEWAKACVEMSLDIDAAVRALFDAGVEKVTVQDFHRTAYNLLPELIDPRARVRHGYRNGKVYGVGDPGDAQAVLLIGLHAASGSAGFLPHTLTSRIAKLEVNGRLLPEAELFAASLAPYKIRPLLFSGCPVACRQAREALTGIITYQTDKTAEGITSDPAAWRKGLQKAVRESLNVNTEPYQPTGPFHAVITMRDGGDAAGKIARRWNLKTADEKIMIDTETLGELYYRLIRLAYLTPMVEKLIGPALALSNLQGVFGLNWVRRRIKQEAIS